MDSLAKASYSLDAALNQTRPQSNQGHPADLVDYFAPQAYKQTAYLPRHRTSLRTGPAAQSSQRYNCHCRDPSAKSGRAGGNSLDSSASSSPNGGLDTEHPHSIHDPCHDHGTLPGEALARQMYLMTVHVDEDLLAWRPLEAVDEVSDEEDGVHRRDYARLGGYAVTGEVATAESDREKAGRVPVPLHETRPALVDRRQAHGTSHSDAQQDASGGTEALEYDMEVVTRWVAYHRALAEEQRHQFEAVCGHSRRDD